MSAGKSEVVRYQDDVVGDICGPRFEMSPHPTGDYVLHSDYATLESLLLDARAELAAKDDAYRLQFEACASMNGKLERAEALAGDRLALLIEARAFVFKDDMQDAHTQSLPDRIDAAIDAVGGRGLA